MWNIKSPEKVLKDQNNLTHKAENVMKLVEESAKFPKDGGSPNFCLYGPNVIGSLSNLGLTVFLCLLIITISD